MKTRSLLGTFVLMSACILMFSGVLQGEASAASKNVFRVAWVESSQPGMNPFNVKAGTDFAWNSLIYEPLWIPKFGGGVVPWLAKSWEYDKGEKAWTVHLVERAKWHDGRPVTAEDVKFTFEAAFKYNLDAGSKIKPFVQSIEIADKHTIRFIMKEDYANFLWGASGAFIVPKHIWSKVGDVAKFVNSNPVGSGPFVFKEYKPERYLHVVKNKNYWRGPVHVDGVLYKVYTNTEAKFMALQKGDVDAVEEIRGTFSIIPILEKNPNIKVVVAKGSFSTHLLPNHRRYPLNLKEVRQAISLAVDRKEIIEVGMSGYADPPLMGFLPPLYASYANKKLTWPGMNITAEERYTKANAILEGLGFKRGKDGIRVTDRGRIKVRLRQPNWPSFVRIAQIMKENMREIGIEAEVLPSDPHTVYHGIIYNPKRTQDWEFLGPHNSTVKGLEYYTTEWGPETDSHWMNANACGWKNEKAQALLRKIRREMDEGKRVQMMMKAQEIFAEELPTITLCHKNMLYAYRTDKFTGWNTEMVVYGNMYYPVASLLNLTSLRPK
ncbi:MAG: ABC transporter substrate-binding protein [Deltaproteobacteria bacterium]|nr:ABC transporter substrate-binding protein [Deltaproteobacteria bacterium]